MPKSKHQKQQEAIQRKREHLERYRRAVQETQQVSMQAFEAVQLHKVTGPNDCVVSRLHREMNLADERHNESVARLHRLCQELNCDVHGNRLGPSWL